MKNMFFLLPLLFLSSCTSTHRLMLVYESDKAALGNTKVIQLSAPEAAEFVVRESSTQGASNEENILDSFRRNLP